MHGSGSIPLSNRIMAAFFRAGVDMCWLVPAVHFFDISKQGTESVYIGASLMICALVGSLVRHFAANQSSSWSILYAFAAVWLAMSWWLHNRDIIQEGLLTGEAFTYSIILLLFLILAVERGLRAAVSMLNSQNSNTPTILYSTALTGLILVGIETTHGGIPLWPVFLLPLALVGYTVSSRSHVISPSERLQQLNWGTRWAIIATLVFVPFLTAVLLIGLATPGFWSIIGQYLLSLWYIVADIIAFVLYPFAYLAFRFLRLFMSPIPEDVEDTTLEEPEPPDLDDLVATEDPFLGDILSIALRIIVLALVVGGAIWLFRSLRSRQPAEEEVDFDEERSSLWDPEAFQKSLQDFFAGRKSPPSPHYRTETEKIVRECFREFVRYARIQLSYPQHWSPRMFCDSVTNKLTDLSFTGRKGVRTLLQIYEVVRYGPSIEDKKMSEKAKETLEGLKEESWGQSKR